MKCSDFENVIPQLASNGLIDAGTQTGALRHAETCPECAARLADERILISAVRAVRAEIATEQASARVEQVLLSAFREHGNAAKIVAMPQRSRLWTWKVAAIAATILFFTSIGTIVLVRSGSQEAPPQLKTASTWIADAAAPTPKAINDEVAQAPKSHRRTRPRAGRTETVTEYFPLLEGEDLDSLEFTQVVRVQLTPSALQEVGLPLSYASEGEYVKADVVLGHDGIARAIRFVR